MHVPIEIDYRNVNKTEALETRIRDRIAKMDKLSDKLSSCHLSVEKLHEHQDSGRRFRVRLVMHHPPGQELVVDRNSSGGDVHQEVHQVVDEVFDSAERKLKKLVDKLHGDVKSHPHQEPTAVIMEIHREAGEGRLRSVEGQELYFNRTTSPDDFDHLDEGDGVSYIEAHTEEGPYANSVRLEYKPTL